MRGSPFSWGLAWAALLAAAAAVEAAVEAACAGPAHIVFIMVDDMGWNDVSFQGSDQIQTPNIDALAYDGVILKQYYTEAVCTPTRSALLTGQYPMRDGMHGFALYNSEARGIPLQERLLPSYLRELGYATHLVGKWNVGMANTAQLPTARGYDTHYGMRGAFIDYYTYNEIEQVPGTDTFYFGLDLFDGDVPQFKEDRYITDALTDRAVNIIAAHNASRPLFLHVAPNAPHSGNNGNHLQPPLRQAVDNRHIANSNRRLYANIVNEIDSGVAEIVKALAEKGMLENTIIAFMSDNGAPTVGQFNNWGLNLPFRGQKYTPWEGAVRVPAFIWHAGLTPKVWNGLMHVTDWLPTLVAAAGGELSADIDGVNQWPAIVSGGESDRKEVLIGIEDTDERAYGAYRAGNYKVVIGNVTGVNNGYYGAYLTLNKLPPPDYRDALQSCDVTRILTDIGKSLDLDEVDAIRDAIIVRQEDPEQDDTPCLPTPTRGCLYNLDRDPEERHDIWDQEPDIAGPLVTRLRSLWAQQQRRGPLTLEPAAEPATHGYVWATWENQTTV